MVTFETAEKQDLNQQIYLDYKDKTKRCLQFNFRFLIDCLVSLLISFIVLSFDRNQLLDSNYLRSSIINMNSFVNFFLYFKLLLFAYLFCFDESDQLFRSLFAILSIISLELICSILNITIAFLEIIIKDSAKINFQSIYFNENLTRNLMQRTDLQISFILHILLSISIIYNLIKLIKYTFIYIESLRLEKKGMSNIYDYKTISNKFYYH